MKKLIITFLLLTSFNQAFAQNQTSSKQVIVSGFADIIEDILPCVVNISTVQEIKTNNANVDENLLNELPKIPLFEDFKNRLESQLKEGGKRKKISSIGSGFLISKDGFIVTNNHVIDDADEINVSLHDGTKYKAKIIGIDKKTDLALLKISTNKELKFVNFGDSNKSRIGDWVIVVGNPYGLGGSVTVGIVSARGRNINNNNQSEEFIQTDAAINKGNSGGPIFNIKGEVIGISSAIFSPSGGSVGIGFATPSSLATKIIKELKEQGEVTRGWIGVSIQDVSEELAQSMKMEEAKGAFVVEINNGSPAQKGGIIPTDIITKIDNNEISDMKSLPKIISSYPIGKIAKITVLRQGKVKVLNVKVEKMPNDETKKSEISSFEKKQLIKNAQGQQILGLNLVELSAKIKQNKTNSVIEGLLVVEVAAKSEAIQKGIVAGDIIISANQKTVKSIDDLKNIIAEADKSAKKVFFFVKRGESSYAVVLDTQ